MAPCRGPGGSVSFLCVREGRNRRLLIGTLAGASSYRRKRISIDKRSAALCTGHQEVSFRNDAD